MSILIGSNTKIKNSIIGRNKKKEKELEKEITRLNQKNMNLKEQIVSAIRFNNLCKEQKTLVEEQARIYEQEIIMNKEKQLKEENKELQQENERLNNIINELEEYLNKELKECEKIYDDYEQSVTIYTNRILDKLKELKESDKE